MEEGFKVVNLSGLVPTPNIRTNGNWFVGDEDTGVAAKGDTGAQGPQGKKGDQGIQGIQGEKGDKGDQGEKGTDADTAELERLSKEVDALDQRLPFALGIDSAGNYGYIKVGADSVTPFSSLKTLIEKGSKTGSGIITISMIAPNADKGIIALCNTIASTGFSLSGPGIKASKLIDSIGYYFFYEIQLDAGKTITFTTASNTYAASSALLLVY